MAAVLSSATDFYFLHITENVVVIKAVRLHIIVYSLAQDSFNKH